MEKATLTQRIVDTAIVLEEISRVARGYLGMSSLGHPCSRKLWYQFRLCGTDLKPESARVYRLFGRGHAEEPRVYNYLRMAGVVVIPLNPITGKQFEYTGSYGHAKGHSDGLVYNLPELPGKHLLIEIKTHNDRNFTALSRRGIKRAHPVHYCQMQRYMSSHREEYPDTAMDHAVYIAVNKNNDSWHMEIVPYCQSDVDMLINREMSVIESDGPPAKLIDDPTFFTCRFCDYNPICHLHRDYPAHCRTCEHVAVHDNGEWKCERPLTEKRGVLTLVAQLKGCNGYTKNCYL